MIKKSLLIKALRTMRYKRDSSKDYNDVGHQFQVYTKKAGKWNLQIGISDTCPWVELYVNDAFCTSEGTLEHLLEDLALYDIPVTYIRDSLFSVFTNQNFNGINISEVLSYRDAGYPDSNSGVVLKLENGQEIHLDITIR